MAAQKRDGVWVCLRILKVLRLPYGRAGRQYTLHPGADAAAAILYAAMGDAEKVAVHMERLEKSYPAYAARTREMTRQILSGTHPAFPHENET